MPALNRVQLIGYLGKDPETRFTPNGNKVCHFTVAVSRHWQSGEETKESTEWFNIEAWGRLGEVCQQFLTKGNLVFLEGRLQTDHYEQNGEKRQFVKVVISQMQKLDKRAGEPEPGPEEEIPV